ncbi:MAG: type 1 glutamine amidotransferase [Paracoccaceae bacterium]|jgi:GMP synthase (glutamine-hydrolysing)
MRLLIVEGNTEQMVQNGQAASASFVRCFARINPDAQCQIVNPYQSTDINLDAIDGAVFTGAGVSWSTDDTRAKPQHDVMLAVFAKGIPAWGSCNGMQLAATVLGGTVGASPNGLEIGVARQTRRAGAEHVMHTGRAPMWAAPCVHRDEVRSLPNGAMLTATNDHSEIQAFVYEADGISFWGTQYHPELALMDVASYITTPNSVFQEAADLVDDLNCADEDENAAARLGANCAELAFEARTCELINWTRYVEEMRHK